jgi:hypothetical protein
MNGENKKQARYHLPVFTFFKSSSLGPLPFSSFILVLGAFFHYHQVIILHFQPQDD